MIGRWGAPVCLWGLLSAAIPCPGLAAVDGLCSPVHVGLDPAAWSTGRGTFAGRALGQTFLAQDTIITKLTVWRPPNLPNVLGAHLIITEVNTSRAPPRPNTGAILLNGPTLHVYDSNPPGELVELAFVIAPPLHLPRPGLYAFFLQTEACDQGEFRVIASDKNPYPYRIYWGSSRLRLSVPFGACRRRRGRR